MRQALYVYVGTAGIGRMQFGAWIRDEEIDRSDGDDAGTYESLADALGHAGSRYEEQLRDSVWGRKKFEWPELRKAKALSKHGDIRCAMVTFDHDAFVARWMDWGPNGFEVKRVGRLLDDPRIGRDSTISGALAELGVHTERELAHRAWVDGHHPD